MANLTEFGKELRKLRIDLEVSLKDLAEDLKVSSAYLSGIETGRKPVNHSLLNGIQAALKLSEEQINHLTTAASKSNSDVTIKPKNDDQAELALMFARKVESNRIDFEKLREFLMKE